VSLVGEFVFKAIVIEAPNLETSQQDPLRYGVQLR
jgi:hypothetical protein